MLRRTGTKDLNQYSNCVQSSVDEEEGPEGQPQRVNNGSREVYEFIYEEQDTFMHKLKIQCHYQHS